MTSQHFTPKLFGFFRDLAANNEREWFKANQDRYEREVREPALDFIADFEPHLRKISPHFVADTRKVGGSLFRIQRDTRFSKDKTPYKEATGIQFRHAAGRDAHAPGFYLHLEPGECFVGVGLWRPETKVAYAIRERIDAERAEWRRATRSERFAATFELVGDSLVRTPKGYEADHPLIEDLKRKDFIASHRITQKQVTSAGFLEEFAEMCADGRPFMRFLCRAVGVPFDKGDA